MAYDHYPTIAPSHLKPGEQLGQWQIFLEFVLDIWVWALSLLTVSQACCHWGFLPPGAHWIPESSDQT